MGFFPLFLPTKPCALRSTQPLKMSTEDFSFTILVVPKVEKIRGFNLHGTLRATSTCRGIPLLYFMIMNVYWSSCKIPDIKGKLNLVDRVSKNIVIPNFMKIRPVGTELFCADRRTYRHETNSRFLQFCEGTKNVQERSFVCVSVLIYLREYTLNALTAWFDFSFR